MLGSEKKLENLEKEISQRSQKSRRRALLTSSIILIAALIGVSTIIISLNARLEKQIIPVKQGIEKTKKELDKLESEVPQQEIQKQIRSIKEEIQIYERSLPSSEDLNLE